MTPSLLFIQLIQSWKHFQNNYFLFDQTFCFFPLLEWLFFWVNIDAVHILGFRFKSHQKIDGKHVFFDVVK